MADVIFCGNPGVGKSTLLSCVSGLQFRSGLNWGEGLTNRLELQESRDLPGVRFGDTPGLADIGMAKVAADAITEALRQAAAQRREVKLFFVVTTEAGRVRPDDLFTIKQVVGSIRLPGGGPPPANSYGLIINKCPFLEREDFQRAGKLRLQSAVGLRSETVPFTTSYVMFLPNVESMAVADNATALFAGLREFVLAFPGLQAIESAEAIDVSSLEEKLAKAREQHAKDMADLEARLKERHAGELAKMRQEMEASQAELRRRLEEAERRANRRRGFGLLGGALGLLADPVGKVISKAVSRL